MLNVKLNLDKINYYEFDIGCFNCFGSCGLVVHKKYWWSMIFKIAIGFLIFCSFFVGFLILGEYITYKFPNSKLKTWWRNYVIGEDNNID